MLGIAVENVTNSGLFVAFFVASIFFTVDSIRLVVWEGGETAIVVDKCFFISVFAIPGDVSIPSDVITAGTDDGCSISSVIFSGANVLLVSGLPCNSNIVYWNTIKLQSQFIVMAQCFHVSNLQKKKEKKNNRKGKENRTNQLVLIEIQS